MYIRHLASLDTHVRRIDYQRETKRPLASHAGVALRFPTCLSPYTPENPFLWPFPQACKRIPYFN